MRRDLWIGAGAVAAIAIAAAACRNAPPPVADVAIKAAGDTAAVPAVPAGPKPAIACDQADFNFGTVVQGDDAKHTFTVKNTGDAPLKNESARGG